MFQLGLSVLTVPRPKLVETIHSLERQVDFLHWDVTDGTLISYENAPQELLEKNNLNLSFNELKKINTRLPLCVHLMVEDPFHYIEEFREIPGLRRIAVHLEAHTNWKENLQLIQNHGLKAGLAINPKTSLDPLYPFLHQVDFVLCMTVEPGQGGQVFHTELLDKVRTLRSLNKTLHIMVDGGITPATARAAREAGADLFVAGSYITAAAEPIKAVEELRQAITE